MKKLFIFFIFFIFICLFLTGCEAENEITSSFFIPDFSQADYYTEVDDIALENSEIIDEYSFLYEDLCFETDYIDNAEKGNTVGYATACYDVTDSKIIYSNNIYEKVFPASTTKLLTCLTATKYGNLDKEVVISEDNCGITIRGAQLCGFKKGDRLTLRQLLYCLMIHSGNDAALAIAEGVCGDVGEFVALMNKEAGTLGCIDTHMVNPHGLHDPNHYTTPYDIYLILNECMKSDFLMQLISQRQYTCEFSDINGESKTLEMEATNLYFAGQKTPPEGITILGGKTGVTSAAGYCLIIASQNENGKIFITEVFKSESYDTLYADMNEMLKLCK